MLLCHGQSRWDSEDRFTGWSDTNLTTQGADQALAAGEALLAANTSPAVVHTSLQTPAIKTANLVLREMDRLWIPVRRHWRLNERHYGALTGRHKADITEQHGAELVKTWSCDYEALPPEMSADHPHNPATDPRYARVRPISSQQQKASAT